MEAVKAIHEEVLSAHGGSSGLREPALLESAVAAPQATYGGEPLLKDAVEIAAAYLFYLCSNHPFVDGNKRTAFYAAFATLRMNGWALDAAEREAAELFEQVSAGDLDETTLAVWLERNSTPL